MTSALATRPTAIVDSHASQMLFSRTLRLLRNNVLNYQTLTTHRHHGESFARSQLLSAMVDPTADLDTLAPSAELLRDEDYELFTSSKHPLPAAMTTLQTDALAANFLAEYVESRQRNAVAPDRIQTPAELEDEAASPIYVELALQMAYGPRTLEARRSFVLRERVDKLLEEGVTDPRTIFEQAFADVIWAL